MYKAIPLFVFLSPKIKGEIPTNHTKERRFSKIMSENLTNHNKERKFSKTMSENPTKSQQSKKIFNNNE